VNNHLVILKKRYVEAIVDGRKTIESRFTKSRREPFGRIVAGDKLFFKVSSGVVCAVGFVERVAEFRDLTRGKIAGLKKRYNRTICGADEYWDEKKDSRYGVLVWIRDVRVMGAVNIDKKDWRAWVILRDGKDYGLLKKR